MIPMGVLSYYVVSTQNENISFAKQELKGSSLEFKVEALLQSFLQYSAVTNDSNKLQIQSALTDFKQSLEENKNELQFTQEGLASRKREHLKFENFESEVKSFLNDSTSFQESKKQESFKHVIEDIRLFISHLGDTSNIILDPELDTYYIGDVTLGAIPQLQNHIADIQLKLLLTKSKPKFELDDLKFFTLYVANLKADMDRIDTDIQTAINEDKNFNGVNEEFQKLAPEKASKFKNSLIAITSELEKFVNENNASASSLDASFQNLNVLTKETFAYWNFLDASFKSLLEQRIAAQKLQRTQNLLMSLLALLIALLASFVLGLTLVQKLSSVSSEVNFSSHQVSSAGSQVAQSSSLLSKATQDQSESVSSISVELGQISDMVAQTLANSEDSANLVLGVTGVVKSGTSMMEQLKKSMQEITESNKRVANLAQLIEEISEKTAAIDEIVFQTKLLSFNASVEAERAGEHGRGFAVVAQEVGNLAHMSGQSASEIKKIVLASIKEASEVSELNRKNVLKGEELCMNTAKKLDEIHASSMNIAESVQYIVTASKEQNRSIEQINSNIQKINTQMQKNVVVAEQSAAASEALVSYGDELVDSVDYLKEIVFGSYRASHEEALIAEDNQDAENNSESNLDQLKSA